MKVLNLLLGIICLLVLVSGNQISTQNPELVGEDYGTEDIDKVLEDPNFDIEEMTVRIWPNGEIHKTRLIGVARNRTDKIGVVPEKKIVGGQIAKAGEIPYIVALYFHRTHHCGGSIFNKNYVITAAHCVHDGEKPDSDQMVQTAWTAVAGDHSVSIADPNEQKRKLIKLFIHPKYDANASTFDLALLQVDKPFVYNHFVQPIPIGNPPVKPSGEVWVSGWGYTQVRGGGNSNGVISKPYMPDKLRITKVNYISDSMCRKLYSGKSRERAHGFINSGVLFCAGLTEGGQDACQGDSGGPLACLDRDPNSKRPRTQKWLCGVVSTGFGCGLPRKPGFYVKLSHPEIKQWINQVAGWGDTPTRLY